MSPIRSTGRTFATAIALSASLGFALSLGGCASAGQYVWFNEMPVNERSGMAGDYVIGIGDTISIRVYEQEGLSGDVKIRSDGKIAIPLVGELVAAGKRPLELSRELETTLKQFVVSPRVTVNVATSQPISVTVVGEVSHIGVLTLEQPGRLVDAIAQSGGPNDYANKDRIFVLRQFPSYRRIRFKWSSILRNEDNSAQFPLRTGDVIVIE